ncbi:hypothetical protein NM208_g2515 [Fusarium decemcellulare]|uniref:Uncharacterized protein n=1 Tax=Fusarium decemcellulare TaxID=57161 RepID=A0ACC1SST9_9HYPO|nr:hypothetical protein NM208_g2515 [Fusarium decemcellulare]
MARRKSVSVSETHRRVTRSMVRRQADGTTLSTVTIKKHEIKSQKLPVGTTRSASRVPPIQKHRFGLIQETVGTDLYKLLVAAVLWNRTRGAQARPVLFKLLSEYPTPNDLAEASLSNLAELIRPLGLHNSRAKRFIAFAQAWVQDPPAKSKRYRKLHYPSHGDGLDIGKNEVLGEDDPRQGWEVAHLPSLGPYALDSYRIFHRDMLRGLAKDWTGTDVSSSFEPEWKRVVPTDKELRAYVRWMWLKEGWIWDPETGNKSKASVERMEYERARSRSLSPEAFGVGR